MILLAIDMDKKTIPNVRPENIGSKTKPLYVIKGFIQLECWNGHYLYDETFKLKKNKVVNDGHIELWVDGEIAADNRWQFSDEQINAYRYLLEHQEGIKDSIVDALRNAFPRLLSEEYASWDHDEPLFPKLSALNEGFDFKDYIGPESISIGEDIKDGTAYVNWRFRCRWDTEHGLEIITHNERVIDIGADPDPWKIYRDNGTYEKELKAYNERMPVKRMAKKKWWQFWR